MKLRLCTILFVMAFLALGLQAKTYTVENLPNVQLQDSSKLLVNPDGIISVQQGARIDSLLCDIRRQSTAEVVAVIVDDIDGDVDDFATNLFNTWGVGKKDVNNGVVILVAKDRRRAVIRTGYGDEGLLPDVICKRILRDVMTPCFKEGDYEGGMLAGVSEVHRLTTDPAAIEELKSKGDKDSSGNSMWGIVALVGVGGVCFAAYRKGKKMSKPKCQKCNKTLVAMPDEDVAQALTPEQKFEVEHHSRIYNLWKCPECGDQKVVGLTVPKTPYAQCPHCGTYAVHYRKPIVAVLPTPSEQGKAEQWGDCEYCGESSIGKTIDVLRENAEYAIGDEYVVAGAVFEANGLLKEVVEEDESTDSSSSYSSSHSSYSSSSRSRGGSFGGGRSGGGGASHGW